MHASCATCLIPAPDSAHLREQRWIFPFSGRSLSFRDRISWNRCDRKEYLLFRDVGFGFAEESIKSVMTLITYHYARWLDRTTFRDDHFYWYTVTEILQMPVVLMMRQLSGIVCLRSLKFTKEQTSAALIERCSRNTWSFATYDLQKLHKSSCDTGCTICCTIPPFFVPFPVTASFIVRIVSRRCNDAAGSWRADKFRHRCICIVGVPIER